MQVCRLLVFSCLTWGMVGFAAGTVQIPVSVSLDNKPAVAAILEFDGMLTRVRVGEKIYSLRVEDPLMEPATVEQLKAFQGYTTQDIYRAIPFEFSEAFKNAQLKNIALYLSTQGTMARSIRISLEFSMLHRRWDRADAVSLRPLVGLGEVKPQIGPERPALLFGENPMPVTILKKMEVATQDSHGNARKEWRAIVVPVHSLESVMAAESAPERGDVAPALDVPLMSLVYLDAQGQDRALQRILAKGLDAAEKQGMGFFFAGTAVFPKAGTRVLDQVKQVVLANAKPLEYAAIAQRLSLQELRVREAARQVQAEEAVDTERANQLILTLGSPHTDTETRKETIEELRLMGEVGKEAEAAIVSLLAYRGEDQNEIRMAAAKALEGLTPLKPETVIGIASLLLPGSKADKRDVLTLLTALNKDDQVSRTLFPFLIDPQSSDDAVASARTALKKIGLPGDLQHQLVNAFRGAPSDEARRQLVITITSFGTQAYETPVILMLVEALKEPKARQEATELLLWLDPEPVEVHDALIALMRESDAETAKKASEVLSKSKYHPELRADSDIAALIGFCRRRGNTGT